jgi:hypothetical protein
MCLYVSMHMRTIEILLFFTAWRRSSLPSWNYTFQDSLKDRFGRRRVVKICVRNCVWQCGLIGEFVRVSDAFCNSHSLKLGFEGPLAMKAEQIQRYPKYPAGQPLKKEQWDRQKLTISNAMVANSSIVKYCKCWMRNENMMRIWWICWLLFMLFALMIAIRWYPMCFLDLWPNMVSVWRDLVDSYLVEMAPE